MQGKGAVPGDGRHGDTQKASNGKQGFVETLLIAPHMDTEAQEQRYVKQYQN